MESLKKYPVDFTKTLESSFNLLYRSNIRFLNNHETFLKKYWRSFFVIPSVALLYVTCAVYIYMMLSQEQIFLIAYLVPPFLVCTQAILKAVVLIPNTAEVSEIIEELGNLWRTQTSITETQGKMRAALLKKLNFTNSVLYWISLLGTWQYFISPILETLFRRLILKQDSELLLPMSCSFPLGPTDNWLIYIGIYVFQTYSMFFCVFVYVGAELIMITLCAILGIEFTLICEDLQRLKPAGNRNETYDLVHDGIDSVKNIKDFVKRHQKLIELSRKLDKIFNPIIFFDLFFVGITTCFFRYAAQFSRGPTYMANNYVAVFGSLQQVMYLCYYGELLTGASLAIGDAAYKNLWYKGNSRYRKIIWLIIKRSQTPCCLTSMRYALINLNMFTKVISSTWSYLSLMNSVYEEEED